MGLHRGRADARGRDRDRAGQGLARAGAAPPRWRARLAGRGAGTGLALAAVALTTAGCGLGGSTKTVTVVRTHTVTVTHTVTQQSGPGAASACTGSQLSGTFTLVPGSAGAGHIEYLLTLTNTSQSGCYVSGVPTAVLLGASGSPLPTHVTAAGGASPHIDLAPGASAKAAARFSPDVPGQGDNQSGACQPKAYTLQVTPDGGGTVAAAIKPPTRVCEQGTLSFDAYSASG